MWVLLVTDGTVIEYAPEAYDEHAAAEDEARRWAWILSGMGWLPVDGPFEDRWHVGDHEIRIVEAAGEGTWVGTFWTWDGAPDPEAALFATREEARAWATGSLAGIAPASLSENEWCVIAVFARGDDEAYAVVNRLKRLAVP